MHDEPENLHGIEGCCLDLDEDLTLREFGRHRSFFIERQGIGRFALADDRPRFHGLRNGWLLRCGGHGGEGQGAQHLSGKHSTLYRRRGMPPLIGLDMRTRLGDAVFAVDVCPGRLGAVQPLAALYISRRSHVLMGVCECRQMPYVRR